MAKVWRKFKRMTRQYLSIRQLSELTPWTPTAIRRMIARGILVEGRHYTQPFGWHSQIIFRWDAVRELIEHGLPPEPRHVRPTQPPIDPDEVESRLHRLLRQRAQETRS